MKVMLRNRLPLGLILLVGTGLRLFRLGAESLWYDETVSVMLAGSPLRELLRHTAGDIHPPGYYLLLRAWLLLSGYPTGHADPAGNGLEFAAGFLSLAAGVLLIALVYSLARRLAGRSVALPAAALVALSPFNLWYSQEVRMYTLGACLGTVVVYALFGAAGIQHAGARAGTDPAWAGGREASGLAQRAGREGNLVWWAVYALAAAAGMYTLYYFVFLLLAANLWLLAWLVWTQIRQRREDRLPVRQPAPLRTWAWLLANGAALLLYSPWVPVAWRQATDPPVPPWRTLPDLLVALRESWVALSLGQSAPGWLWPALLLTLMVYALGIFALLERSSGDPSGAWAPALLVIAPFGSLALILLASAFTPLYNVRYVFTYSPAFYVVLGAGLAWLWSRRRAVAGLLAVAWLGAAAVTGYAFWEAPTYQTDDHRAAVHYLQSHWRPGDVVVVNAGYAYSALLTYWDGPLAWRGRLSDLKATLPAAAQAGSEPGDTGGAEQPGLVLITTGHVDGDPGLGWGDPRSDFFAMPAEDAARQLDVLFARYSRVWQYRIYDTVNDPRGTLRDLFAQKGQLFDDQVFAGVANMRLQGYLPREQRAVAHPGQDGPAVTLGDNLRLSSQPLPARVVAGGTLYPVLTWQTGSPLRAPLATSLRLVGPDGATWSQPPDELPLGPLFRADAWQVGRPVRQPLALPVPAGTPPGRYSVVLLVYDPATGRPWARTTVSGETPSYAAPSGDGINLGQIEVAKPAVAQGERPVRAQFGPLALVEAGSPAAALSPGDQVPVELLWQATHAPGEPLVVVIQLLDGHDSVVAGLEAQPLDGRYPTQDWASGELVRDRHNLALPANLRSGAYRLVVGVYRAANRQRLNTRSGLFGQSQFWVIKTLSVG
jgi:mannosyltransferase